MAVKRKKVQTIGDITLSITRGILLTASQLSECLTEYETGYRYVTLSDLMNNDMLGLKLSDLAFFDPSRLGRDVSPFCAEKDTILFAKNDTPFKVDIISNKPEDKLVIGGNIYMITVDSEKVKPQCLRYWLQSEEGMARLRSAASFAGNGKMRWISIKSLEGVIIPEMTVEFQREVIEKKIKCYESRMKEILDDVRLLKSDLQDLVDQFDNK